MSLTRYSREVDLDDLNNVHTFAVLAVPSGSRVLDLGAADGSVARVLTARGCDVTAVERDPEGVMALTARGLQTVQADLEALAESDLPRGHFDVVLLLDVLEHLVDPAALLARVPAWLAPGGRVLISVPHVAHGAVRLSLMQGRFPRTETGLLDRTHLHFFDLPQVQDLLDRAGLRALDVLTVERGIDETELPGVGADLPPEVFQAIASDPLARVYQFFLVATVGERGGLGGGLLGALMARIRALETAYHELEDYTAHVASEAGTRSEASRVDPVADAVADRDTLRRLLGERMAELEQASETIAVLQRDIAVHREFAESLAAQVPRIAGRGGEAQVLAELDAYHVVAPTPAAAAVLAREAAEFHRLQGTIAFRALARLDAWSRRVPRVRSALRAVVRRVAGLR